MMKAVKIKLYFVNAIRPTNCCCYLLLHYCKRRYCVIVGYDVSRRSQGIMSSLPFATALAQHFTAAALQIYAASTLSKMVLKFQTATSQLL
jgi:hypothetical protein